MAEHRHIWFRDFMAPVRLDPTPHYVWRCECGQTAYALHIPPAVPCTESMP